MEMNNNILVETLIRGRNSARRLQNLVCRKAQEDGSVSADDLVTEISNSFANGLLLLNPCGSKEICRVEMSPDEGLARSVDRPSEVLTGNNELIPPPLVNQGRGRYKRKTMVSRVEISDTCEDAYQWRKYGQKGIQNSKFPRCYYRCTHKDDRGCMALKHVQQLEEESNKFRVTYFGAHTCPNPHFVSHSGPGVLLDFEGFKNHGYKNVHNKLSRKQKDPSNKVLKDNDARLSPALVPNDLMIEDFYPCFEATGCDDHVGSSPSSTSHDALDMDFFDNLDFFGDILVHD